MVIGWDLYGDSCDPFYDLRFYPTIWYSDQVTDWTTGVPFPAGAGIFSLRHRVQTNSGVYLVSYPMDTGGSPDTAAKGKIHASARNRTLVVPNETKKLTLLVKRRIIER
jgi:hypothetical protein